MEENVNLTEAGQPQPAQEALQPDSKATTPEAGNTDSAFVEVKFNKETKKLTLDEAATLAQKGMKFDTVAADLERLKNLSKREGLSVTDFLSKLDAEQEENLLSRFTEKCGGDTELARKLLDADKGGQTDEFAPLKAEFPQMTYDDLPDEVKAAAELKGTGLLFEYLLYEHRQRVAAAEEISRRKMSADVSLGSLSSGGSRSAVDAEFLKGVWGR